MQKIYQFVMMVVVGALFLPAAGSAVGPNDFIVYSVFQGLDMGDSSGKPAKDFYVNMGSKHGLREDATLAVYRETPTYDLNSKTLYGDIRFPIAELRVIHVDSNASVARLKKMYPVKDTPTIVPPTVMVGDIVTISD